MARTRVAVVAATAETVEEDIHRALDLVGGGIARHPHPVVVATEAPDPGLPGGATKPWQWSAWARWERDHGHEAGAKLWCATPRTGHAKPALGWRPVGGAQVLPCRPGEGALVEAPTPLLTAAWGEAPRRGEWGGDRAAMLASVVQSPRWAVRGAVALACDAQRAGRPWPELPAQPDAVAELFRMHRETLAGAVCLVDATVCGSASRRMRPRVLDLILAGTDPVAVDSVAAVLMGWIPRSMPWLVRLEEEGLGVGDPAHIECVGGGPELSSLLPGLRPWRPPRTRRGGVVLTRLGEVGRRVYHALLWQPWVGRPLHRLYAQCPWGRLEAAPRWKE